MEPEFGMMTRRRALGIGGAAIAGLALAACGSGASSPGSSGGSRTLIVDTAFQLTSVDPGHLIEPTGVMLARAMYDTLLTLKGGDLTKPVPNLATSYAVSPDGRTYTFTLDPAARFSDGRKVTSADVVFSLTRVANLKGSPSFFMDGLTVTASGDETVVITSAQPNAAIPAILTSPSLGILNSAAVRKFGGTDGADADKADNALTAFSSASYGSGPFVLKSYSPTSRVVLVRNPNYWGNAKPGYAKVVVQNVEANVQKLNVLKGVSQIAIDLSPQQVQGMSNVQVLSAASPNLLFTFANRDPNVSKVTSDPSFAEAVRYGIDYDKLVALAGSGASQATGIIPTMFLGALPADQAVKRDVTRAKAAVARMKVSNPTVTLAYPSDIQMNGITFGDVAASIQSDLEEIGITVKLKGATLATAKVDYIAGKEEMGIWAWSPDYPDPNDYNIFLPGQPVGVRADFQTADDPALAALGTRAAATADSSARAALYQEIQQRMNASSPFFPLIEPASIVVGAKSVKNLQANAIWSVNFGELG